MDTEPIFSKRVSAGSRVYYIDAHVDRQNQQYITIAEIRKGNLARDERRQQIFIHAENIAKIIGAIAEVALHNHNESEG